MYSKCTDNMEEVQGGNISKKGKEGTYLGKKIFRKSISIGHFCDHR